MNENLELKNSNNNGTNKVQRDYHGRLLPGSQLDKTPRPEVLALRKLKSDVLNQIAPAVIPTWLALINDASPKIRLGAVKLAVETIFPKQIIQNMVIRHFNADGDDGQDKIRGLLDALPQFGEFLAYKAKQDANKVIDVEPDNQ